MVLFFKKQKENTIPKETKLIKHYAVKCKWLIMKIHDGELCSVTQMYLQGSLILIL